MIGVRAPKLAERHNCPDHKAFRAAFTKSAQKPQNRDEVYTLNTFDTMDYGYLNAIPVHPHVRSSAG
jgi:hypothetical protein